MLAALNDLKIISCDIGNSYLNAPCRENIWTVAGSGFSSDKGKVMHIDRALYGMKSSRVSWRHIFSQTLLDLGYESSRTNPDL